MRSDSIGRKLSNGDRPEILIGRAKMKTESTTDSSTSSAEPGPLQQSQDNSGVSEENGTGLGTGESNHHEEEDKGINKKNTKKKTKEKGGSKRKKTKEKDKEKEKETEKETEKEKGKEKEREKIPRGFNEPKHVDMPKVTLDKSYTPFPCFLTCFFA